MGWYQRRVHGDCSSQSASGRQGQHRTIDMKAFVAVFAGIAAASAAPKADPWLLAAAPVYLGEAHPLGKREADAEPYYGLYGYGVAPVVEAKKTGLIFTNGAVTPDFTDEVKEDDPAIAADSKDIKVPVVTGYSVGY